MCLIVWNRETKICDISCPLSININKKVNRKLQNYNQLVWNLQVMYPDYKFQVVPIVAGPMGSVSKCLTNCFKMIRFSEKESKVLTPKSK